LGYGITQLMSARAEQKAHGDVLRLWDHFEQLRAAELVSEVSTTSRRQSANRSRRNYVQIYHRAGHYRHQNVDFPYPVEYLDQQAFSVLRNMYEMYQRDDLLSDLVKHLRQRAQQATAEHVIPAQLALACVLWWDEESAEAVEILATAAGSSGDSTEMKFLLADAYVKLDEPERAIDTLDAITTLDQATVQQRETRILELATRAGFVERAREAAERLFGVRMNTHEQLGLATQMHHLGLHDLGNAVLRRARQRNSGNRDE
jgi:hypothetical protein